MKAIIAKTQHTGKIRQNRKENKFTKQITAITLNPFKEVVEARFYWTNARCYCCVWIHAGGVYASGGGYAGGYGYCKESAALGAALRDAGVKLSEDVDGRGQSAIESALVAVARAATGKRTVHLVRAHG